MEELLSELRKLTREAREAQAADPRFLRDLEDLAQRFDQTWPRELLHDGFGDGDYRRNPAWTVLRGEFRADSRQGLVLDPTAKATSPAPAGGDKGKSDPGAELAMALLGSLMNQNREDEGGGSPATDRSAPAPADELIYTRLDIPNAYAVHLRLTVQEADGAFEVGVFQREADGPGYRLALVPGRQGSVELLRVGSRGTAVVDRASARVEGDMRLEWSRDDRGKMSVKLDGEELLASTDRGFEDPFVGLQLRHQGGRFLVREVTLLGSGR